MNLGELLSNIGIIGVLIVVFLIYGAYSKIKEARMTGSSILGSGIETEGSSGKPEPGELTGIYKVLHFFFGFNGLADRGEFLVTQAIGGFLILASWTGAWLVLFHGDDVSSASKGEATAILSAISYLVGFWICLATTAKRFRDLGVTAWATVLMIVPPLNLALFLILLFAPEGTLKRIIQKPTV